ncbi:hypothetical protein SGFS_050710 [Streptomyces graminofaciens]|uniref:Secreted protein n=1 Tax=Streptomyces graminofaciens TaxID=68212 RepID=A0ABN5VK34_9ACTN|nr:hypothetical protein SGFS_050710 [Streptomyces graminofaciens]
MVVRNVLKLLSFSVRVLKVSCWIPVGCRQRWHARVPAGNWPFGQCGPFIAALLYVPRDMCDRRADPDGQAAVLLETELIHARIGTGRTGTGLDWNSRPNGVRLDDGSQEGLVVLSSRKPTCEQTCKPTWKPIRRSTWKRSRKKSWAQLNILE